MASTTRTTIWTDNQILNASTLNNEFNHLLDGLNLVNSDISAGAGIAESKITFSGSGHGHTGGIDGKLISINRAFGFANAGAQVVANDTSWNPITPEAMTVIKIWAHIKTAPTGANLITQVYNVTKSLVVAPITITAGATDAN